jgi:hypothetical protein
MQASQWEIGGGGGGGGGSKWSMINSERALVQDSTITKGRVHAGRGGQCKQASAACMRGREADPMQGAAAHPISLANDVNFQIEMKSARSGAMRENLIAIGGRWWANCNAVVALGRGVRAAPPFPSPAHLYPPRIVYMDDSCR